MSIIERIGEEIPDWNKYYPLEPHYACFTTNIIASAMKICDVFHTFCSGRAGLLFTDCDDFGSIIKKDDEVSKLWFKSVLVHQSLVSYNICIDLSWQVVWLFLEDTGLDLLYKNNVYKNSISKCCWEALEYKLVLAKQLKLRDYLKKFFNNPSTKLIREKYNYFKHRGTFHVPGLGMNYKTLSLSFENIELKSFHRDTLNLSEWIDILIQFHKDFHMYFENVIKFVIPRDYLSGKAVDFGNFISYCLEVKDYLSEGSKG